MVKAKEVETPGIQTLVKWPVSVYVVASEEKLIYLGNDAGIAKRKVDRRGEIKLVTFTPMSDTRSIRVVTDTYFGGVGARSYTRHQSMRQAQNTIDKYFSRGK